MRSFAARMAPHTLPELIDGETDAASLTACLKDLAGVNRLTFGHRPSVAFARRAAQRADPATLFTILDVGSGYGDTLRAIARALAADGVRARLTGADLNPVATAAATEATRDGPEGVAVDFVTRDARDVGETEVDAIQSSLFMHHLEDEEIVPLLAWMDRTARVGWFVNDLYRSRFAATGFGALAALGRRHPHVRHDGPVSFARAFRRADWERLLSAAGISGARAFIAAPYRLCVEKLA